MKHPPPNQALEYYRAQSPMFVVEAAEEFKKLSIPDQLELLFYMGIHQAKALTEIGAELNMELTEAGMDVSKGN